MAERISKTDGQRPARSAERLTASRSACPGKPLKEFVAQNFIWRRCAVTRYGCAKTFGAQEGAGLSQTFVRFAVNGIVFNHESPRRGENFAARKICRAVAALNPENRRNLCWATRARSAIQKLFRPVEPHHLVSNAAKARRRLNWQPEITFEQIITQMMEAELAALLATG